MGMLSNASATEWRCHCVHWHFRLLTPIPLYIRYTEVCCSTASIVNSITLIAFIQQLLITFNNICTQAPWVRSISVSYQSMWATQPQARRVYWTDPLQAWCAKILPERKWCCSRCDIHEQIHIKTTGMHCAGICCGSKQPVHSAELSLYLC